MSYDSIIDEPTTRRPARVHATCIALKRKRRRRGCFGRPRRARYTVKDLDALLELWPMPGQGLADYSSRYIVKAHILYVYVVVYTVHYMYGAVFLFHMIPATVTRYYSNQVHTLYSAEACTRIMY